MNKTRTTKLTMVAFLFAMVFLMMPMNTFAAKKPGQVKNIEEVKATDKSVTIKFDKVKGAKSYQVEVHIGGRKHNITSTVTQYGDKKYKCKYTYSVGKKIVKKTTTKKTTCTIKGIGFKNTEKLYAVKVRAFDGKNYGKWGVLYVRNTRDGVHAPGKSAAVGKNLKKQYEAWKKKVISEAKEEKTARKAIDSCIHQAVLFGCTENIHNDIGNNVQYSMEEVYQTYKRGYGTNLEIYCLIADICKDAGFRCRFKGQESWYGNHMVYALVVYFPDEEQGEFYGLGYRLYITSGLPRPGVVNIGTWYNEEDEIGYLGADRE